MSKKIWNVAGVAGGIAVICGVYAAFRAKAKSKLANSFIHRW